MILQISLLVRKLYLQTLHIDRVRQRNAYKCVAINAWASPMK